MMMMVIIISRSTAENNPHHYVNLSLELYHGLWILLQFETLIRNDLDILLLLFFLADASSTFSGGHLSPAEGR